MAQKQENTSLWETYEKHLRNIGLTKKRISKLKTMFNTVSRGLDLRTASREEIEDFVNRLNEDRFKTIDGRVLAGDTKSDIKKFLKQYYKHTKGSDTFFPEEVAWLRTKIPKDERAEEKPIIELEQVRQLARMFHKYDYQVLTLLLFDSGFRIQEMMSCKRRDLTWEEFDNGKKCFWLKCNVSKTFPRKIPVPIFTKEINDFFESATFKSRSPDDHLFDIRYESYRKMLKRYSLQFIKKELTPHCLRHSSATYYARIYSGNVPLLAQRYGWAYSARELQTYVRASGAYNKEGAKLSYTNEVSKLRDENEKFQEQIETLTAQQKETDTKMALLLAKLEGIENIEKLKKAVEIAKNRKK